MNLFAETVADLQSRFEGASNRELASYITAPERVDEARGVEGCVERAVLGELDPTGWLAISRYTRLSPPGLAEQLTRKGRLDVNDPEQRAIVAGAARKTLAIGWLFSCDPDAEYLPARDERAIWSAWAPSIREPLTHVVDSSLARLVHNSGLEQLVPDLKAAGMTRLFGGSKVHQIAYHLSQAGYYLRMTQTDALPDDAFERALEFHQRSEKINADGRGRWAWDAYPIG